MTSKIYRVRDDEIPGIDGEVQAVHRWTLPGLRCGGCRQTWSSSGIELPSVDLSPIEKEFKRRPAYGADKGDNWPVRNDEMERLVGLARPFAPDNVKLVPGAKFGPLVGYATGPFVDFFTWSGSACTILAKTHVVAEMEATGLNIKTVKAELEFEGGEIEDLYEFEILPQVHVYDPEKEISKPCPMCGRLGGKVPQRLIVYEDTWPEGADLVRAIEFQTVVLCSARFRDVVFENGWLGIRFEEVETSLRRF